MAESFDRQRVMRELAKKMIDNHTHYQTVLKEIESEAREFLNMSSSTLYQIASNLNHNNMLG